MDRPPINVNIDTILHASKPATHAATIERTSNIQMATWQRLTSAITAREIAQQATRITGCSKARISVRGWRCSNHIALVFTARVDAQMTSVKIEVNRNIT